MTVKIFGALGSYPEYYLSKNLDSQAVVILPNKKRLKVFVNDFNIYSEFFQKDIKCVEFPDSTDPFDLESQIKRNFFISCLLTNKKILGGFTPESLSIQIDKNIDKRIYEIHVNKILNRDELIEYLVKSGYIREDFIENEGEFTVKGGVISVFIPFTGLVELDYFGDEIENIYIKSRLNTRKKINKVTIFPLYDRPIKSGSHQDIIFEETDTVEIKNLISKLKIISVDTYRNILDKTDLIFYSSGENENISTDIDKYKNFKVIELPIRQPVVIKNEKIIYKNKENQKIDLQIEPLKEGDLIIHEDFGIGIFKGIETKEIKGKKYDFMILQYADSEKIYVSYLHFDKIHKYKGTKLVSPDKLGGTSWRSLKRRIKNSLKKMAKQLIKLYSERQGIKREPLSLDNELLFEFERSFPYIETPDQLKAILDVKKDLSSPKPMERVICGDVGFGKTEVALRAVFINTVNGRQSLVLTPTTVLSYQHYKNFKERLEPFGIVVENLSRLKNKKETEEILSRLSEGKIDVVIGTHKALNENVKFKNLGLLVIDEEHRFGVRAKEKIRLLKKDIDTLYMTATPIPRTLNMALSGLKDISVINTPPEGRVETKTIVSVYSEDLILKAVNFELNRNGQIFYLHNRVETIYDKAKELQEMFPKAKIGIAHGRMKPKEIEKVILNFIENKIDILVSTSIIETGIDIPTANTLIIERADTFGLAQLYHLRGRVGRGNIQAYCYLLVPNEITETAEERINVIKRLTRPGSGLKVSIEDMKIRGVGNILGVEQSGYIKTVGYEMYIKLLQEAINEESGSDEKDVEIIVGLESFIPEEFISDPQERMNIYMTVSKLENEDEIERLKEYLSDFYDGIPKAFNMYLEISKLKRVVKNKGIDRIELKEPITVIHFNNEINPDLISNITRNFNINRITSNKIEIFFTSSQMGKLIESFKISKHEEIKI
ncbi:DEAD/DEAH box helicase [Persephonella sp.]